MFLSFLFIKMIWIVWLGKFKTIFCCIIDIRMDARCKLCKLKLFLQKLTWFEDPESDHSLMFGLWLSGARAKSEEIEGQAETQGEIITRHRHWGKHQPYLAKCHPQTVRNCPLKRERDTFNEVKCSFSDWHHDREWMLVWPGWDAPSHSSPSIAYSLLIIIATIHENPGHAGFQGNCDQTSFVQCSSF